MVARAHTDSLHAHRSPCVVVLQESRLLSRVVVRAFICIHIVVHIIGLETKEGIAEGQFHVQSPHQNILWIHHPNSSEEESSLTTLLFSSQRYIHYLNIYRVYKNEERKLSIAFFCSNLGCRSTICRCIFFIASFIQSNS